MGWLKRVAGFVSVRATIRPELQHHFGHERTYMGLCAEVGQEARMCENLTGVVLAAAIGLAVVGLAAYSAIQLQPDTPP